MADPENQGENPQNTPEKPADAIERMRAAGIDPNAVVNLLLPVVDALFTKKLQDLDISKQIDTAVEKQSEKSAEKVIAYFNAKADEAEKATREQQASQVLAPGRAAPGTGTMAPDNPMMAALFNRLLGGGGSPTGDGSLDQMAKLAASWGNVMKAIMQPVVEMQATMRQSLLTEMATYSKTGGTMPWEVQPGTAQPERKVANLNQDELKIIAEEVAKRIRLT